MKTILMTTMLILSTSLIGCASQNELNEVRQLVSNAQVTADAASQCCVLNTQKVDRMYQKIMSK